MIANCQVCGNPMFGHRDMGYNVDGSINNDFCSSCYKFGHFIKGDEDLVRDDEGFINSAILPYAALGTGLIANTPGFIQPMQ